jgi:hypothetical protein
MTGEGVTGWYSVCITPENPLLSISGFMTAHIGRDGSIITGLMGVSFWEWVGMILR